MAKPKPTAAGKPPSVNAAVFAAGLTLPEAEAARCLLEDLKHPQLALRRYVYVIEAMQSTERVKTQAMEALFPEPLLALRNQYIALPGGAGSDLLRDGIDLLCLSALLDRPGLDCCILVRGAVDLGRVPAWLAQEDGPVLEIGSDIRRDAALAFRRADPDLPKLIGTALELYQTGAVLGLASYSLERVLRLAVDIGGGALSATAT